MEEFEIDGRRYRCQKLNAFQQLAVVRRLTPLFLSLADEEMAVSKFGDALSSMKDADAELVVSTCMGSVQYFNPEPTPGTWAKAWNQAAQRAMFEHLQDIVSILPVVMKVVEVNLGNFTDALAMLPSNEKLRTASNSETSMKD